VADFWDYFGIQQLPGHTVYAAVIKLAEGRTLFFVPPKKGRKVSFRFLLSTKV
jgi:hypothetical protein